MKQKTSKKFFALLCAALLLFAKPIPTFAFTPNPVYRVDGTGVTTLAEAFEKAKATGSVITQDGNANAHQVIRDGIEVEKDVTLCLGHEELGLQANKISYESTGDSTVMPDAPLFTILDGGVLRVKYSAIYGHDNWANSYGGLFRVKKGGMLILDGTSNEPVVISGSELHAQNAKGGAIYCEQGGKVIVNGATFASNRAVNGADIFAEQKTDVTIAPSVKVNVSYGESVDINGLNLVLTGEIGLTFHTVVPDRYTNGSFVLTSRTGDTLTYKIDECGKDGDGRYLAKYNLSSIELSEPITLTVCDEEGFPICSETKSCEEYGKTLLEDETVTEKEKKIIRALFNYGHFVQIECSGLKGWEIGKDYIGTEKYANLSTDESVFDDYAIEYYDSDPDLAAIGVQLNFDYKTGINIYFAIDEKPAATVNDESIEVESYEDNEYRYRIKIKDISALDLARTFEITLNGIKTMTLSAMSYGKLAAEKGSVDTINAVKALYEFYQETVKYNEKPTSPGEDY